MYRESLWRHFDFWLLGSVAILTVFGITMIQSAIAGNIEWLEQNTVNRQIAFALIGFAVILAITSIDYHLWSAISRPIYIITAVTLALMTIFASERFGSARWLQLGLVNIQPSEFAKIIMIVILADFFSRNQENLNDIKWIIRSFLLSLGVTAWILLQPDLSTSIVIFVLWFSMLWVSGLKTKYLLLFLIIGIIVFTIAFPFLKNYQQQRILTFIFPSSEASYGNIYNINQAKIAIGSGGWLGKGYGQGTQVQLRFLKVRISDFIFSAMSEEFGFAGAFIILALLLFIVVRCIRVARLSRDTFGALIAYGVATLIAFQTFVNVGMNLNLIPVTGLPLPFVSYGGSSLLTSLLGIGLVESVVIRYKALNL